MMFICADVDVMFSTSAACNGQWKREYLPMLQERPKWNQVKCNLEVDDVILAKDDNAPRNVWPIGVVTKVEPDAKGLVRSVFLGKHTSEMHRPVNKLVLYCLQKKGWMLLKTRT